MHRYNCYGDSNDSYVSLISRIILFTITKSFVRNPLKLWVSIISYVYISRYFNFGTLRISFSQRIIPKVREILHQKYASAVSHSSHGSRFSPTIAAIIARNHRQVIVLPFCRMQSLARDKLANAIRPLPLPLHWPDIARCPEELPPNPLLPASIIGLQFLLDQIPHFSISPNL